MKLEKEKNPRASPTPPRFLTCSFQKLHSFLMPFSFSPRILSKLLKKSAKSLKNAFSHGSRAVNTLYQLPAISNLRYTLFLILNENLIPSYHYSARILRANFRRNSANGAIFSEKSRFFNKVLPFVFRTTDALTRAGPTLE